MNKEYVKRMVCFDESLQNAQEYIKDHYGISSKYDSDVNIIHLSCDDIKKTNKLIEAKQYIIDNIGEDLVQIEL